MPVRFRSLDLTQTERIRVAVEQTIINVRQSTELCQMNLAQCQKLLDLLVRSKEAIRRSRTLLDPTVTPAAIAGVICSDLSPQTF